jgi:predicted amidophosphoribosyltransferase
MDNTPVERREVLCNSMVSNCLSEMGLSVCLVIAKAIQSDKGGICYMCGETLQPEFKICPECEEVEGWLNDEDETA